MGGETRSALAELQGKFTFILFFSTKDFLGFVIFGFIFIYFTLVLGYAFMDAENFIPANPLITPAHIQPE